VAAEVNDVRPVLVEGLEQIVGAHRPARDQFQLVAVFGRPDLGLDLAHFLIEGQARQLGGQGARGAARWPRGFAGVCREEQDAGLGHAAFYHGPAGVS
jgi:hypothetical protein